MTIENPFVEVPVAVRKYAMQGTDKEINLKGAAFSLQKKEANGTYQPIDSQTTNEKVLPVLIHSHLVNIESLKQLVLPDMILRREIMNSKSINMEKSFTREKIPR